MGAIEILPLNSTAARLNDSKSKNSFRLKGLVWTNDGRWKMAMVR